ncbi:MAG: hypothetical protein CEE40_03640 [Chloroflexi bacterium B3_Chlor]|nr:MAG: hypothetical protein CEE40_03640 [Chloroflexi bacterium B3_Chlor]
MSNDMIIRLLEDIKGQLVPISDAFQGEYDERLRVLARMEEVVNTDGRKTVYPVMNGLRTQAEIATEAGVSRAMVSRFVPPLLEAELIEIVRDGAVEKPRALYHLETGRPIRRNKHGD